MNFYKETFNVIYVNNFYLLFIYFIEFKSSLWVYVFFHNCSKFEYY